jgi:hypothetical protein
MLPWIAAAAVLGAIIAGVVIWNLNPTPPAELHQVVRFDYELPEDHLFSATGSLLLAVSPDGSRFVYNTTKGLYLRSMDGLDAKLILGIDENPAQPFFSPDGQWVGYWSQSDRQLKKIAISGGAPVTLCNATIPKGPMWSTDDTIVYVQQTEGILKISASGGTPECLSIRKSLRYQPHKFSRMESVYYSLSEAAGGIRLQFNRLNPESRGYCSKALLLGISRPDT